MENKMRYTSIYVYPEKGMESAIDKEIWVEKVSSEEQIKLLKADIIATLQSGYGHLIEFEGSSNQAIRQVLMQLMDLGKKIEVNSNQLETLDYAIGMEDLTIRVNSKEQYYEVISKVPKKINITATPEVLDEIYGDVKKNRRINEIGLIAYNVLSITPEMIKKFKAKKIRLVDYFNNISIKNIYSPEEYFAIQQKISRYFVGLDENMPEEEIFFTLYKKLGSSIYYDYESLYGNYSYLSNHNLTGILSNMNVCEGMAITLSEMLAIANIQSYVVRGMQGDNASTYHAWNRVLIGKKWYNCDLTNDATYIKEGLVPELCLISDKKLKEEGYSTEEVKDEANEDYDKEKIKKYFSHDHNHIQELIKSENLEPKDIAELINKVRNRYPTPVHITMFSADETHYGLKFRRELASHSLIDISEDTPTFEKAKRGEFLKEYKEQIGIGLAKRGILLSQGLILRYDEKYNDREQER